MAAATKPHSRIAWRILKWAGGVVLVLLLLPVIAILALQTAPAKRWLAATLSDVASEAAGSRIAIGAIEGTLPIDFSVASLEMADADGVWLHARDLRLAWEPSALLAGRLSITRVSAASIAVDRAPLAKPGAPAPAPEPGLPTLELPSLPLAVSLADLEIGEIRLGAPLIGEEVVAAAFGSASLGGAPDEAEAALTVTRLDGDPGRIELLLAQSPARELTLEATVEEPAGGLIARLANLPGQPAIDVRLAGKGPVTGWKGRLDAAAGDANVGLDLTLALNDHVALGLVGTVDPGGLAGPEVTNLLPRPLAIDTALAWTPGGVLDIDHADVSAPGVDLTLAGRLDPEAQTVEATAEVAATDPALIARLADPVRADSIRATLKASGSLTAPTLDLAATVDRLMAPGARAATVAAEASVAPTEDPARLALTARVTPHGLAIDADPALASLIGTAPTAALDGTFDRQRERFGIASLDVTGAALHATGNGSVAEAGQDVDVALALRLDDLAPLGQLAGQPIGGALAANLRVVGDATVPALAVDLDARGEGVTLDDPLMASVAGAQPRLTAAVTLDGPTIRIERTELTAAAVSVNGAGSVGEALDLTVDATAPDLSMLSAALGNDLTGALAAHAEITGAVDDPAIAARLTGSRVAAAGTALGDPTVELSVAGLTGLPQGNVTLTAAPGGAALKAATAFRMMDAGGVQLSDIDISGDGGLRLGGDLAVGADGLLDGTLDGGVADLAAWQRLAGTPLAGAVDLDLAAAPGNGQQVTLAVTGSDLALADAATIRSLRLEGDVENALAAPVLDARLSIEQLAADTVAFDTVAATAQGGLDDLAWTLDGSSADKNAPAIDTNGRLAMSGAGGTVTLAALTASLPPVDVVLVQPANIAWNDAGVSLDRLEATIGDGRLVAGGRFAPGDMGLDATLTDLPIGLVAQVAGGVGIDGRLSSEVSLAGDPAAPEGSVHVTLRELREAGVAADEAVTLGGEADATLAAGRVDATAHLTGQQDLALDARVSAPMAGTGPLDGAITGGIDLALVPRIVDLRGDSLAGRLDLDLALGGSMEAPRAGGRAAISNGLYESATQGTVLRNLAMEVVGDNDRLRLASLSADDGEGGRLTGTGTVALDAAAGFPLQASVSFDKFTALRSSDATVQTTGTVDIARAAAGGRIAGDVTIDEAEIRIPEQLGGEIVTLEVTEINLPPGQQQEAPEPEAPGQPLDLAITVDVPARAFVRGRGLESEWSGKLNIGGTTAAPDITGSLDVVRGTLDLLSRIFTFDKGKVNFIGGGEINPELAFSARSEDDPMTVVVDVSGTASAPKFALTSEPPLPQDEILAQLLFGSSAAELSPAQAIQLAQTAAQLSGGGGGSMLDDLRETVGLDMLGVESGATAADSSLSVGKYVTDDVYVKMNQGMTPESRQVGVEVRVLPQVTVESNVGAQSQGNVGVNWRLDY